jgi:hypothetical protein
MIKQRALWTLREVNKGLILGLKIAIFMMEGWDEFLPEKRQSMFESLQRLISQSNKVYRKDPTKH